MNFSSDNTVTPDNVEQIILDTFNQSALGTKEAPLKDRVLYLSDLQIYDLLKQRGCIIEHDGMEVVKIKDKIICRLLSINDLAATFPHIDNTINILKG